MRISDWSSDVCSSDLAEAAPKSAIIAKAGRAHNRPASPRHRGPDEPMSSTASIARPDTVAGTIRVSPVSLPFSLAIHHIYWRRPLTPPQPLSVAPGYLSFSPLTGTLTPRTPVVRATTAPSPRRAHRTHPS